MHRALTCTAVAIIGTLTSTALVAFADDPDSDPPELATLEVDIGSRAFTSEYATRDSDGDGWTDWYERIDGTDPYDAASHPGGVRVDLIDTTVFVQSHAHPDRLVALDGVELPTTKDSFAELTDLIASITGTTALGTFHDELVRQVDDIAGDTIGVILADVATHHADADPITAGRTNGQSAALISWDWTTTAGSSGASTTLNLDSGSTTVQVDKNGITTVVSDRKVVDGSGTENTWVHVNGRLVMIVQTEYVDGNVAGVYPQDGAGNPLPSSIAPYSSVTSAPADSKPTDSEPADSKPADTTPASTSPPKPDDTVPPTTVGGYVDPDAEVLRAPTPKEIEQRVTFLGGVKTRYLPTIDVPTELDRDKPGVADPDEPECRDERCVVFTVIAHPDLDRADGACPRTFCNADPRVGVKP